MATARKSAKRARHAEEKVPGRIAGGVYTNVKKEYVEQPFSGMGRSLTG